MKRIVSSGVGRAGALALAAAAALVPARPAQAVSIDAGDYVPAPPGTQLGLLYLQYAENNGINSGGKGVSPNAGLTTQVAIGRYVGFASFKGYTFDYQLLVPWVGLRGSGSVSSLGSNNGIGDPILVSTLWVVNRPKTGTYLGITPYLWLPIGSYNADRALNAGNNRWQGDMQVAGSQALGGGFIGEGSVDVQFNGDNTQYAGNNTLSQAPIYDLQGFLRYEISPTDEINVKLRYVAGGDEKINGVDQNNPANAFSGLASYVHWFGPKTQIMVQGGKDFAVQNGFNEDLRLQFRILRVF